MKHRIFISSVQSEFASARKQLAEMIRGDRLLRSFFDVFLFEETHARNKSAQDVYLDAVAEADLYLAIIGDNYGNEDRDGISPTEREFDKATALRKERLVFVRKAAAKRQDKESIFLEKIGSDVTWQPFTSVKNLLDAVYDALFDWLQEKDLVANKPFDKSCSRGATLDIVDPDKFAHYVELVNRRRKVTLEPDISVSTLLEKIGAKTRNSNRLTNAVFPLFAKRPDEEKISWEIRCSHYYGFDAVKPIPVLKTYNGTVFDLVDQALEFVMSRVDFEIGSRVGTNASAPTKPEFPEDAVQEALVNAVCHRDYTSNACVQVMLFRDRLEIINPGSLPKGTTREDLYRPHDSNPRNEVIAQAMSWTSYVEKSGNGTREIVRKCVEHGLAEPTFEPRVGFFHTILWRKGYGPQGLVEGQSHRPESNRIKPGPSKGPVGAQSGPSQSPVEKLLHLLSKNNTRSAFDMAAVLGLDKRAGYFKRLLRSMAEDAIIEYTIPDKPNSRFQKYRLTDKGVEMLNSLPGQKGGHK